MKYIKPVTILVLGFLLGTMPRVVHAKGAGIEWENLNQEVMELYQGTIATDDLFSVQPVGNPSRLQWEALKSFSEGFYVVPIVLILLAREFVLK